jgi:patatin-like phospholipase/acyl hydrolase
MPKLTRILSIDGGGIRGILPGQILVALEQKLQKRTNNPQVRIADYFDLVAGTSTGGILSCIYLTPDKTNPQKALFTAKDAVNLYLEYGTKIFSVSWQKKLLSMGGISDEIYTEKPLEELLLSYFGDLELKNLLKPCLITSYDVHDSKAYFFRQHEARTTEGRNFFVKDIARATSAAPTYFEAADVMSFSEVHYPLIDGGVFANNPALCAYAEARGFDFGEGRNKPSAEGMVLFSIGTGSAVKRKLEHKNIRNWGVLEWIRPMIDIMMSGVSQTVHYQLKQIFGSVGKPDQYIRIEPELHNANADMDDASPKNLKALKEAGIRSAESEENDMKLNKVVELLLANN